MSLLLLVLVVLNWMDAALQMMSITLGHRCDLLRIGPPDIPRLAYDDHRIGEGPRISKIE